MKLLDCTVLAYEGPILRAYLSVINALGYKVRRIVPLYNGNRKLRWLPKKLREPLLFSREALRNNYWPLKFMQSKEYKTLIDCVMDAYKLGVSFFSSFQKSYVHYSNIAEEISYFDWEDKGWKHEQLFELLKSFGKQTYLFTGGGLVPRCILELPDTEFVHVHPGFLPYTRGADGILWSLLTRERPGAACFYMVPKLDEGNVILTEEYASLSFKSDIATNDLKTRYRLVFSFYDPAVRALCLKHVLEKFGTLTNLPNEKQEIDKGITFHFMHDALKEKVLRKIFNG